MRIKRFEEIAAWQESRKLTRMVYGVTNNPEFTRDFGLSGQIQRAAVSVMSNVAEGFESGSKAEFIRFLSYARRSASEVQCHLYVAADQRYVTAEEFRQIYDQAERSRKLVSAFARYLRQAGNDQPANRPTREPANAL